TNLYSFPFFFYSHEYDFVTVVLSSPSVRRNEGMFNNCAIYSTKNQNGLSYYSSASSSSFSSSSSSSSSSSLMGMVYADMGSLSLCSNYGIGSSVSSQDSCVSKLPDHLANGRAFLGFPFSGNCFATSSEEQHKMDGAVDEEEEGKD
ncbi:hypothetical protein ACMBCN_00925, partial [Candidatus Liberibacter asiaticus]|nr:hypothetical protein [Candidatus Liberibacter asiaticus]